MDRDAARLREVAFHEAGHTIVSDRLGLQVGFVTIEANHEDGSAGSSAGEDGLGCQEYILALYAGYAAECLCNAKADVGGSARDDQWAREVLDRNPEWNETALRARTQTLVEKYRTDIEEFAQALLEEMTLDPDEAGVVSESVGSGDDWRRDLGYFRSIRPDSAKPQQS